MLWLSVKVGESVYVGDSVVKLVDKDRHGIVVTINDKQYSLERAEYLAFRSFTLHVGQNSSRNLRLGFEAPKDIKIRREKLETRLPSE